VIPENHGPVNGNIKRGKTQPDTSARWHASREPHAFARMALLRQTQSVAAASFHKS